MIRTDWRARARTLVAAGALALVAGCATTQGGNGDVRDPLEGFNRSMFAFNEAFDDAIAKPVAKAYKTVAPDPVRTWIRNFFANLGDVFIGVNNLLQGKPADAITDWARFAFNSTFGVLGINDVASEMGLEKHNEDFGQTFGRWGVGSGAYIVWPIFGSSTVRDTAGSLVDGYVDPVRRHEPSDPRNFALALRAVGARADLLDASRILEEAALDKYIFQRDAFLQRRRGLVHDGNPPRQSPRSGMDDEPRAGAAAADWTSAKDARPAYAPRLPSNYDAVLAASRAHR